MLVLAASQRSTLVLQAEPPDTPLGQAAMAALTPGGSAGPGRPPAPGLPVVTTQGVGRGGDGSGELHVRVAWTVDALLPTPELFEVQFGFRCVLVACT